MGQGSLGIVFQSLVEKLLGLWQVLAGQGHVGRCDQKGRVLFVREGGEVALGFLAVGCGAIGACQEEERISVVGRGFQDVEGFLSSVGHTPDGEECIAGLLANLEIGGSGVASLDQERKSAERRALLHPDQTKSTVGFRSFLIEAQQIDIFNLGPLIRTRLEVGFGLRQQSGFLAFLRAARDADAKNRESGGAGRQERNTFFIQIVRDAELSCRPFRFSECRAFP